jgi:hypothetical protein
MRTVSKHDPRFYLWRENLAVTATSATTYVKSEGWQYAYVQEGSMDLQHW